jgi:UDP-glucuronate 4-epimerase
MNAQPVLLTGAAGFIGSHAAQALLASGYRVVGLDNFSDYYLRSWKELNLRAIGGESKFDFHEMDVTDAPAIQSLVTKIKPQAIIHLAGMAGVRPSIAQPAYYARVNVEGTTILLQAAVENKTPKFLFASSSSVYGNPESSPFTEDDPVAAPISPYAATKRAGELMGHAFWHLHKLPVFCLRFFTVYGPRLRPDLAIHKFARLISRDQPIPVFGDGSSSRDYTYVDDICAGILAALNRCDRFRIYNLGNNHPVKLSEMIRGLESSLGKTAKIDCQPMQPGDVEMTCADITRSKAELGYQPKIALDEGLKRFIAWFRRDGHLYQ